MAARLVEFLRRYQDRPFRWGQDDCSLFIADWWMENHGTDPAVHLRGTYDTKEGAHRVVDEAGGILRLVGGLADRVGAPRQSTPVTGNFGVIEPGVCAIYVQGFWVARSETGLVFNKEAKVWRVWSLHP